MALNRWQKTIVDAQGNIVPGAILMIRRESDQALVTVYKDREGTQAYPMGQVTADGMGYAYFYAPADLYRLTSAAPAIDWRDVDIGAAVAQQIAQQALDNALPTYETLLDMQADTGQDAPTLGRVVNDADPADNGYYVWDGVSWERSSYQPATPEDVAARLRKDQNLADLDDAATARDNLGLGTAAVEDVEAFATAAQGEAANTAVQPSRKVEGGDGLAGGGDLSENRIITLSGQTKYDLDQIYAQIRRAEYGDGPYPVFDQVFGANARFLDPRITLTRPGKSWRIVNGVLREYDVNEPVLTGDGWSLRPPETNLLDNGNTSVPGYSSGLTRQLVTTTQAPDGSDTTILLTEATNTGVHYADWYNDIDGPAAGSLYLKYGGRRHVIFLVLRQPDFQQQASITFDLLTGETKASAGLPVLVEPLRDGFYRLSIASNAAALRYWRVMFLDDDMQSSYTGDGESGVYAWGRQLNTGGPIPPIPTTSSAVTRPADNASIQGDAFASIWNPMEGAVVFDYADLYATALAARTFSLAGASGALLYVYHTNTTIGAAVFNDAGATLFNSALTSNTRDLKIALAWTNGKVDAAVGGNIYPLVAAGMGMQSINKLFIDPNSGANKLAAVTARRLTIFNRRPSDAQMEALTS